MPISLDQLDRKAILVLRELEVLVLQVIPAHRESPDQPAHLVVMQISQVRQARKGRPVTKVLQVTQGRRELPEILVQLAIRESQDQPAHPVAMQISQVLRDRKDRLAQPGSE